LTEVTAAKITAMPNAMESRAKIERGVMAKLHTRIVAPARRYIDLGPGSRGHVPSTPGIPNETDKVSIFVLY
jgi:hypothetical protein